jgi:putative acetyltransferase
MIRKASESDLDFIYGIYMHPKINPFLLYEMMDKDSFKPIFNDLLSKNIKYVFEEENKCIGMFKLIPLTYRCSHIAYLGGLAIDVRYAGKGFGNKMLQEIIAYAKQQGFLRIELSVANINEKAISLYEKVGFKKEGLLRKYSHLQSENRFMDEIIMSWLAE